MEKDNKSLLVEIADYYSSKLIKHGENACGVDWNGEESQKLRFDQLCKIIKEKRNLTINDLGCGYGALYDFLVLKYPEFSYLGIDISKRMIQSASQRFKDNSLARFIISSKPDRVADYSIASGIFNVRMNNSDDEWQSYVIATLKLLDQTSSSGFSFNCLTSYSDKDKMKDYLYYADPCKLFNHCKRLYSRNVALIHDYDLYEFTILVKK